MSRARSVENRTAERKEEAGGKQERKEQEGETVERRQERLEWGGLAS